MHQLVNKRLWWYQDARYNCEKYISVISEMTSSLRTPILPERFPVTYRESQHAPWLPSRLLQRSSSGCYILRCNAIATRSSKRLLLSCVLYIPCSNLSHDTGYRHSILIVSLHPFNESLVRILPTLDHFLPNPFYARFVSYATVDA